MNTAARPRGRRPGNDDTRGTIRDAAKALFSAEGYDRVSLRAIARAADVDPALVHHYYDSKAALFVEALLPVEIDLTEVVAHILAGDNDEVGLRAAKSFMATCDDPEVGEPFARLIRQGEDQHVQLRAVVEFTARELYAPVAEHFGHEDAALRGQLAAAATLGVFVSRSLLEMRPLSSTAVRTIVRTVGQALQHYLVDEW